MCLLASVPPEPQPSPGSSADGIRASIACGDVTGASTDGELRMQLQELNDSDVIGAPHLVDNRDGTTTVTVSLTASMH